MGLAVSAGNDRKTTMDSREQAIKSLEGTVVPDAHVRDLNVRCVATEPCLAILSPSLLL